MLSTTVTPRALHKGDCIAFISPSARLNEALPTPMTRAQLYFENLGYKVKVMYLSTKGLSYMNAIKLRCEEIHQAFKDPEVRALVCTLGGFPSNELLPHLDYDLIRENPKIFVGCSDITMLHNAFLTQAGLRTFYGPAVLSEFAEYPKPDAFTADHFFYVLQKSCGKHVGLLPRSSKWANTLLPFFFGKEASLEVRDVSLSPKWTWARKGSATGRIIGGCLPTVVRLIATKYWPSHKGKILFLEAPMGDDPRKGLSLGKAGQLLTDLVVSGVLRDINGLVFGRPYGYDSSDRLQFAQMVQDRCYESNYPILLDVDIGHTSPMLTIPMNSLARLDAEFNEFSILEPSVSAQ